MEKQEHQPIIILIAGYARAGKDTIAGYLEDLFDSKTDRLAGIQEKFANPLYSMLYGMYKECEEAIYEAEGLEDGFENNKDAILPYAPNGITVRKALQSLGTEWGRDVCGDGIWANLLCARINRTCAMYAEAPFVPVFLISDHRFVSEGKVIREAFSNVISIYVQSDAAQPQTSHRSEQELEQIAAAADYRISNNGTLDDLYNECVKIVEHLTKTN